MEWPSSPPDDPFGPSTPANDLMDTNDGSIDSPEPDLLPLPAIAPNKVAKGPIFDLSSDPIAGSTPFSNSARPNLHRPPNRATNLSHSLSRNLSHNTPYKRPLSPTQELPTTKEPRLESQELVLQARDLLIKAYSATSSRIEQTKLLDLIEVFREFTEYGKITKTSAILATQVANLEQATRKIEKQASIPKPNWAKVAQLPQNSTQTPAEMQKVQDWTQVGNKPKKGSSSGINNNTTTREISASLASKGKDKSALSRRCTLLQAQNVLAN